MRGPDVKSYAPPFELNKPITNSAIVKVLKSATPKFQPGNILVARQAPTSEYAVFSKAMLQGAEVLQNSYGLDEKLFLGALGMPGLTAYSSYYEIGAPKKGETIFISAASGAVGQIVGQLAKHDGLKVVGSVGDDKKLEFIKNELKFDGGFNYKKVSDAKLSPINHIVQSFQLTATAALGETVGGFAEIGTRRNRHLLRECKPPNFRHAGVVATLTYNDRSAASNSTPLCNT